MYKTRQKQNRKNSPRRRHFRSSAPRNGGIDIKKYTNKDIEKEVSVPYVCTHNFSDFQLHPQLLRQIEKRGYQTPTEIQDKSIPSAIAGHDVIGIAGTGTGKTAAFLIPIIQGLINDPADNSALVVAPTRELASQIMDEFKGLVKGLDLYATALIGGTSVNMSIKALKRTNHIIIGTPGRLLDMMKRGHLKLNKFKTLVLDEFDRMLDMGFLSDIQELEGRMQNKEQTLLFSATIDGSQKNIIKAITKAPVEVKAGISTQKTSAIEQDVIRIPRDKKKFDVLHELIVGEETRKVLLFCETKRRVNEIHKKLVDAKVRVDIIHGDKTQKAREKALRKFRSGHVNVLVATDVVARGIDVTDISLVINYEVPNNYNDYIHRIGRTGRAGKTGKAVTFVD